MSYRKKLGKILTDFLQVDMKLKQFRNKPTDKQRKYKNIEISQDFKRIDEERRKQRFENIKKRKQLLQYRIKNQSDLKLLTTTEQENITGQLKEIIQIIDENKQELEEVTDRIDQLEPEYMLIENHMKLSVLNHIKHLQYLDDHNPGFVLYPQTIQCIQNIHYCVNHNLPINRIKLYEIMPEYFESQIGELQESVKKLITQKKLYGEKQNNYIKFFYKTKQSLEGQGDVQDIMIQKQTTLHNIHRQSVRILSQHGQLLTRIFKGQTPFRNITHFHAILQSDMPIKYLPQQESYKQDLMYLIQLRDQYYKYAEQMDQKAFDVTHTYVDPPPYVARHPFLMKQWEKMMVSYTNPKTFEEMNMIESGDQSQTILGEKMQEQMRRVIAQKYDPMFVEMMNTDRSLIDNKKLQIQFYNLSTKIMEDLKQLPQSSSTQEELFEKIPKEEKWLLGSRKKPLIKMDQFTRMLHLNNKDKVKYNVQFFAQWLGVDKEELRRALSSFSYLRALPMTQEQLNAKVQDNQDFKYEIIRFQLH